MSWTHNIDTMLVGGSIFSKVEQVPCSKEPSSSLPKVFVVIHGIGKHRQGWSRKFQSFLAKNKVYSSVWSEATWSDVTQPDQDALRKRLGLDGWIRGILCDFGGDVCAYTGGTGKHGDIHLVVNRSIREAVAAMGGAECELVVVAHSLGSVIASDVIWDIQASGSWPSNIRKWTFLTLGSPIALYGLRYGIENFNSPVLPDFWYNFVHPSDPIAMALKPLNAAYCQAVTEDVKLNVFPWGLVPLVGVLGAHTSYFQSSALLKKLGG